MAKPDPFFCQCFHGTRPVAFNKASKQFASRAIGQSKHQREVNLPGYPTSPFPPLATQQAIVAEIEAEHALVNANRELIARFEKEDRGRPGPRLGRRASRPRRRREAMKGHRGNPGLKGRLLNKSVDAYVLALETINRLSIQYRLEAFCYLICNAWELLLKGKDSGC